MCLPTGEIYLYKVDGTGCNVMNTDCVSIEDFENDLNYLFTKCGYNKSDYDYANYVENSSVIYTINLD